MQEFPPPVAAEGDALPSSLRHQLIQLRSTAHGLTTAQARLAPLPSPLSIAGLLIHSAQVVHGWLTTIMRAPEPTPPEMYPEVSAGIGIHGMFPPDQFPEDASLAKILEVFDRVVAYIDDAADAIDLDVVLPENSPWQPGAVLTGRWVVSIAIALSIRPCARLAVDGSR